MANGAARPLSRAFFRLNSMKKHKIDYRKISHLIPYAGNSRTHSEKQIQQIASSIKEFGFTNPILIEPDGGIIAGHGRVSAASLLDIEKVPCIIIEGLTEAQKKALVIADNQLALNAGWDLDVLSSEIQSLAELGFDLDVLGFDEDIIDGFVGSVSFEPATEEDQGKLDELDPIYISCPHCGKEFDQRSAK